MRPTQFVQDELNYEQQGAQGDDHGEEETDIG